MAALDPAGQIEFSNLCRAHGVVPWLMQHLPQPDRYLDADLLRSWGEFLNWNSRVALAHSFWTIRLTVALEAAGIRCLPIKGVAAAVRYYGSVAARTVGDIDLMVAPAQLEAARTVVLGLGLRQNFPSRELNPAETRWMLRRRHHLTFVEPATGFGVELHWALHDYALLDREDTRWADLADASLMLGGRALRALDPVRDYLLLLTHLARSRWERIKWLLDVQRAWEQLGPIGQAGARERIGVLRLEPTQHLSRRLASAMFGVDPAAMGETPTREMSLMQAIGEAEGLRTQLYDVFNLFRLRRDLAYRLDTLAFYAIAWQDIELLRLPSPVFWLYLLLRPGLFVYRLLGRGRRALPAALPDP